MGPADVARGRVLPALEPIAGMAQRDGVRELGVQPWFDATTEELIDCGARPDEQPEIPGALTAHERRVAKLVSEGMSYRQVAAELAVSAKTVSYHLSNIYAKLGVHSRVQMVKVLNEQAHLDRSWLHPSPPGRSVRIGPGARLCSEIGCQRRLGFAGKRDDQGNDRDHQTGDSDCERGGV